MDGQFLAVAIIAMVSVVVGSVYVPDTNRAVVEHNGRITGAEDERLYEGEEAEHRRMVAEGMPTPESEGDILKLYDLYNLFLTSCSENGQDTTMTETLQTLLAAHNMSEETAVAECRRVAEEDPTSGGSRRKRSFISKRAGLWERCIVPYTFDDELPQNYRDTLGRVFDLFHKYSGFRFVAFTGNNSGDFGLPHNNYLNFINGGGCWSYVGNARGDGQNISPCNHLGTAVHEIGHALGFYHEQSLPAGMDWITTYYQNMYGGQSQYYRPGYANVYNQNRFYDMSDTMHYASWMFSIRGRKTMRANDPDLDYMMGRDNFYYFFRDAQPYHSCLAEFGCDPVPVCENGGYPTVMDGACACRCPEGLDSATNCTTVIVQDEPLAQWPEGTFAVLKSNDGACPSGLETGYTDGGDNSAEMCSQTVSSDAGNEWGSGEYCILQLGDCPKGFTQGWIKLPGSLPGEEYATSQQLQFCCRDDAAWTEPLQLPNTESFVMYRKDYWGCQQVEGMLAMDQSYHLKGAGTQSPEFSGSLPLYDTEYQGDVNTYSCAYVPLSADTGCGVVMQFAAGDLSYDIQTPNYPSDFPTGTSCMWHFKSPPGTTMMLDFEEFELPEVGGSCNSYVELKTHMPGMPAYGYCGSNNVRSRWTYENYLTVKFVGGSVPAKGFNASVKVLRAEDMCYAGSGLDGSYSGTVNYTRYFNPCLPWTDVQDCFYNQFEHRMIDVDLNHNYCRNVGTGQVPWCYVDGETCRRENCDACMQGRCLDLADDCAWRVSQDPDYCSRDELGEPQRLCKDTCGWCARHTPMTPVRDVTCGTPGDVTCVSPEPVKTSYSVGETVRYNCPYSDDVRTRICTSDGTWTSLNIVCNACPSGWTVFQRRCYKWLGWDQILTHSEATAACGAISGHLPKVNNSDVTSLIITLTDINPEDDSWVWIGMSRTDGEFRWDDGDNITYNLFVSNEPSSYDKCVYGGNKWYGTSCTGTHQTVCEHTTSAITVCEDDQTDCETTLERMPDLCTAQPDYAWQNCRATCAVGDCDVPVKCVDEGIEGPGARVNGSGPINQGQYTEYACADGNYLISGNLIRACLPSGKLTGQQPVCTGADGAASLVLGDLELRQRYYKFDRNLVYLLPNQTTWAMPADGRVVEWLFYSRTNTTAGFQIWRKTDSNSSTEFALVGQNEVEFTADEARQRVRVPVAEQVAVRRGDIVGVINSGTAVPYSRCSSTYDPQHTNWHYSASSFSASTMTAGLVSEFKPSGDSCRQPSLQLVVSPCDDCHTIITTTV